MIASIKLIELLIYFVINFGLVIILASLANIFVPKQYSNSKTSIYECGFDPFTEARLNLDIHFYVVSILFIIFDIEIVFLLPWLLNLYQLSFLHYYSMVYFILLFIIGYVYEIKFGTLRWIWMFKK